MEGFMGGKGIPGIVRTGKRLYGTRKAKLLRNLVIAILAGATIVLSSVVFSLEKNKEKDAFNTSFSSYAEQLIEEFRRNLQDQILALDSFSIDITSYAIAAKMEWPLVTLPDFPIRGEAARQQMKANAIGLLPLVTGEKRERWEAYVQANQEWVEQARSWEMDQELSPPSDTRRLLRGTELQEQEMHHQHFLGRNLETSADFSDGISKTIYRVNSDGHPVVDDGNGPFMPIWLTSPAPPTLTNINFNLLAHQHLWQEIEVAVESQEAVISKILNMNFSHDSIASQPSNDVEPISAIYYPVFDGYSNNRELVGLLASELQWSRFFEGALPSTASGLVCVIENACGQVLSFHVNGPKAVFLGQGDLHDREFDGTKESRSMSFLTDVRESFAGARLNFEPCPFSLHIYPSEALKNEYKTNDAMVFATSILALFFISAAIFFVYDKFSTKRSRDDRSVVVLERLFPGGEIQAPSMKNRIMKTMNIGRDSNYAPSAAPSHFKATIQAMPGLASLKEQNDSFADATVMFADIYGLEAWSTGKDVEERNELLDTVLRTFNVVAKRYGISQVEMSGDSFVAITGIEVTKANHACVLVLFACECRKRLLETFKSADAKGVAVRFGLHSGHVEAGGFLVDNSQYRLFGDTVDTTYQMLSSSRPGKIHVSVETAELLNLAGKGDWLAPRSDLVLIKGKGEMSTFWIKPKKCLSSMEPRDLLSGSEVSTAGSETSFDEVGAWESTHLGESMSQEDKLQSVVDKTVEALLYYLKKIQLKRNALYQIENTVFQAETPDIAMGDPVIEEACEPIRMPIFDGRVASAMVHSNLVELSGDVESQLRLYVSSIASTYKENAFHNIEHAAHVTLTMEKMIKKLTAPENQDMFVDFGGKPRSAEAIAHDLDDRSFGLASDPLTQFALLFASLVHDVDHVGVSNQQLIKEGSPIASLYNNHSISEQNAVDIAWWLLMTPNFTELRAAIYVDKEEMQRFRQIMVNTVVATDILDRKMKIHRDKGWKKAFESGKRDLSAVEIRNLQATMVVERMMQAADHGHTMQNFSTYLKWSQRIFDEMKDAYHAGRAEKDPGSSWFVSELAFFDKFIIPLASQLRDCGVFGTTGEEYLQNAMQNRKLWASSGKKIVEDMKEKFSRKVVSSQEDTVEFSPRPSTEIS